MRPDTRYTPTLLPLLLASAGGLNQRAAKLIRSNGFSGKDLA